MTPLPADPFIATIVSPTGVIRRARLQPRHLPAHGGETDVKAGDRVAYPMVRGTYAEHHIVPARLIIKVSDALPLETAAAVLLQGTTAHYLTRSTFPLKDGQVCLVHAAAGGAGGLVVQMAKAAGARVIGTVSTQAKAEEILALGADHAVIYTEQDFEAETMRLTDGRGVDVVYDSVGKTTFDKSLAVLRPRGLLALFGQSSGPVAPVDPLRLNAKSLFFTRPSLGHYLGTTEELRWRATEVFDLVAEGRLKVRVERTYPLAEAAQAHRDLESRKTSGKLLLAVGYLGLTTRGRRALVPAPATLRCHARTHESGMTTGHMTASLPPRPV